MSGDDQIEADYARRLCSRLRATMQSTAEPGLTDEQQAEWVSAAMQATAQLLEGRREAQRHAVKVAEAELQIAIDRSEERVRVEAIADARRLIAAFTASRDEFGIEPGSAMDKLIAGAQAVIDAAERDLPAIRRRIATRTAGLRRMRTEGVIPSA